MFWSNRLNPRSWKLIQILTALCIIAATLLTTIQASTPSAPNAYDTFTIFRDSTIPASGIAGGYGYASYTMEPSTAGNGKYIFQTGNWYASRSYDNGSTWSYLNPFSMFGSGYCCDQV